MILFDIILWNYYYLILFKRQYIMVFNVNHFKVCIYGHKNENINSMASNFPDYKIEKIVLTDNTSCHHDHAKKLQEKPLEKLPVKPINETNVFNHYMTHNIDTHDVLFVNADSVKKVKIEGTESIYYIINMIETKLKDADSPYVILFNRYMDNNYSTHYIGDISKSVSLFRSFRPKESDCFFLSRNMIKILKEKHLKNLYKGIDVKRESFRYVKEGLAEAFSFNPNLFTFMIEKSENINQSQSNKTTMIKGDETRSMSKTLELFFSDHIILFWCFVIFFTCTMFIVILKTFNLMSHLI